MWSKLLKRGGIQSTNKVNALSFSAKRNKSHKKRSSSPADRSSCQENFQQYLVNSTLHGLRYVGETEISLFERIFFMMAFFLVFILSAYFISNIYNKWSASPLIIGLNAVATSINDIPFPAVTICNMNQARKTIVQTIEPNSIDEALLESLCQMETTETADSSSSSTESNTLPDNFTGKWSVFRKFLLETSQPCNQMLRYCRFAAKSEDCMELFNTVLTDDGLCCTFNSVHPMYLLQHYNATDEFDSVNSTGGLKPSDWTPENGWNDKLKNNLNKRNVYPRPGAGPGSHMGLFVILDAETDDYYCSSTNSKGFKIILHNPTETPKIADFGFSITTGDENRVVITPRISDASKEIRSISKYHRQCIFADETNLSYFRTYSRKNCQMECESRIIEDICGCVQYYMPRIHEDSNICSRRDNKCFLPVSVAIDIGLNETFQCNNCLPGCFEIYYQPTISTSTLSLGGYSVKEELLNRIDSDVINKSISTVYIYYEESSFRSHTKSELIGFTEFLSNTGGLLGLFMGFSVVSLIEILYFMSLRPYCAAQKQKKYNLSNSNVKMGSTTSMIPPRKMLSHSIDDNAADGIKLSMFNKLKEQIIVRGKQLWRWPSDKLKNVTYVQEISVKRQPYSYVE